MGPNPGTAIDTVSGAPISDLYESVNGGTPVAVSDDVDSGGVYGTIPSSLVGNAGTVPPGTTITVYDSPGGTELYSYTTGTDSLGDNDRPDGGVGNFDSTAASNPTCWEPIFIDYTNDTLSFDDTLS